MIFQNICAKLFPDPAAPLWAINPLAAAVSQFALSYWYSLANFIAGAFDDMGRWHDQSGPTHMRFGAIHIDLGNEKSPAVVAGLPQRSYVWSNPWHTNHEPLTPASLSFFTKQNFFTFQIVRHPLDLVVSNAAKITALAGERAPQLLLQNDEWMEGMLKTVEAYFAEMVKCKNAPGVEFVSYEELLSTPVPTIRKLAETMEVKGNDKTYEKIWNELKNKTLSHDAGHLWDPRADKWREFIPARFAKRICNSPLRDYAAQFGYRLEEKDFMENQAGIPNSVSEPLHIAWRDAQWGAPIGKIPISHPDLYRVDDRESGLLLACGKRYAPAMERLRTSPMLRDLMAASGYKGWQEPSLITDCLGLR